MRKLAIIIAAACALNIGCTKKETADEPSTSLSPEAQMMSKATTALKSAATGSNGLLNGTGMTSAQSIGEVHPQSALDPATDCTASGSPASNSGTDYAIRVIYCSLMRSPDGPDTVRGGLDRVSGFLCALGNISYDGQAHTKTMTLSSACFSQTFLDMAVPQVCPNGENPCTTDMTVTGHDSVTGVGPATGYDKYFTIQGLGGSLVYTVLVKDSADEKGAAILYGLPTGTSADSVFAVSMNKATGTLRYEGRFVGGSSGGYFRRHIRANLVGTMDSSFNFTDVQTLEFVHGEYYGNGNNSGWYITFSGTPAAGRRLLYKTTTDISVGTPTWSAGTGNNQCLGESSASCTGNSGIAHTGKEFFFATAYTSMESWFQNKSDIGQKGTIDMDGDWD